MSVVVPDFVEPVEAYRCWTFEDGKLKSLNGGGTGQAWTPGEALTATCNASHAHRHQWRIVKRGMSREKAEAAVTEHNTTIASYYSMSTSPLSYWPSVPAVDPPDGYGFALEADRHSAPDENCTCGIYAATEAASVPSGGNVYGKVKLWGKVVPGHKGYRAQYAYPSEFRVSPEFAEESELLAFGVPIVVDESVNERQGGSAVVKLQTNFASFSSSMGAMSSAMLALGSDPNRSLRRKMIWSTWINCTLALANLTLIGVRLFG